MTADRLAAVRACFAAFVSGDREVVERCFADDLEFFSPADPGIDRDGYFARCWPGAGSIAAFDFVRLVEIPDGEVLATYEATRADGSRFRNTEIFGFAGDRIARIEVYFGWELPQT